jgi:hypothetical protein
VFEGWHAVPIILPGTRRGVGTGRATYPYSIKCRAMRALANAPLVFIPACIVTPVTGMPRGTLEVCAGRPEPGP